MRKRKLSPIPPDQVPREDILKEETPETPETSAAVPGREDALRRGAGTGPAGRQDVLREGGPSVPLRRQDTLGALIRRRRRQDVLREG
jgi:hypothetical protein